ncbi:MAG: hypothetical protein K0M40_05560 [Prolixibacteraceae bacterium]|nr:hypothetical protein [Prolixibacteraceae bacterium]
MKLLILLLIFSIPVSSFSQISAPVFNWKVQEISKDNNLQGMSIHDENTAVIAGFGKTFKITTDKGASWTDVGLFNPKYHFNDISITDNVGYIVGRKTLFVRYPTGGEDDVFVNGVVLKTIDNGTTWTQLDLSTIGEGTDPGLNPHANGCISFNPYAVLSISSTSAMVFVHWFDVSTGTKKQHSAVFKTNDGGAKWTAITPDLGGAYINAIKKFESDIYIGGNKILLKASSENDVVTDIFNTLSLVAGSTVFINEIRSLKNNEINVVTMTGVFNSVDGGKTFTKMNGPTGGNDIYKLDDNVMIVLGSSSASKATIDGGATWVSSYPGKTCWEIPGVFNDSLYVLATSVVYKIAISDLKSGNYKWITKTLAEGNSILQKMYLFDGSNALIIGDDQIAKRTTDKGKTWSDATLPSIITYDGKYDFRSASSSGNAGYISSRRFRLVDFPTGEDYYLSGLIYKTEDAWKTWKVLNTKNVGKDTPSDASKNPTLKGCYGMDNYTIECVDAKKAFIYVGWFDTISVPKTVTKHSRVFKTIDGGDLWTAVTKDFGGDIVTSIKFSGETGYFAGNKILLKTIDGGKTFADLYPKLTIGTDSSLIVSSITMYSNDEVYFQTSNNKGAFVTRDGGNTFSKINGVSGGFDLVVLDNNSLMSVGSSTSNKFTNDDGTTWKDCNLGVPIFAAGKVLNDSLYVLGKSNVYKVAVSDLDIKTFVADVKAPNALKVLYGTSALELVSGNRNIDRCLVYSISGQLLADTEPRAQNYRIEYNSFTPGIYIVAALIEGKKYTQKVIFK